MPSSSRALRKLVSRQRALGERAFYHFMPDEFLRSIASGDIDNDVSVRRVELRKAHLLAERYRRCERLDGSAQSAAWCLLDGL